MSRTFLYFALIAVPALLLGANSISADDEDALAQYEMGNKYLVGNGVPKNEKEAVIWIGKAADQGLAEAQL